MANILIDTQIFHAQRFDFDRSEFRVLADLVDAKRVTVLITQVIDGEVKLHMQEAANTAATSLRKFLKEHPVLRHSPKVNFHELTAKDGLIDLPEVHLSQWETWKNRNRVHVLSAAGVKIDEIMADYFAERPPFKAGMKKVEFPDAFSLAAADLWAKANNEVVFVVSGDYDWKRFCVGHPRLRHVPSLKSYLPMFGEKYVTDAVKNSLEGLRADIFKQLKSAFEMGDFSLSDAKGDVHGVRVDGIRWWEIEVIEAQHGHGLAEVNVNVDFTAEVEYEDPDSGIYDSEDKVMLFVESIERAIKDETEIAGTVTFDYQETEPGDVRITDIRVDDELRYISIEDDN